MAFMTLYRFISVVCAIAAPAALCLAGCEKEDDPLTREGFCEQWASAVCGSEVTSVCQTSLAQCQASQADSCRDWLPADFQDEGVDACLKAVSGAYADADLNAAELDVVWRLGAPCNGIVVAGAGGDSCERDADCSGSAGLTCVLKDRAAGTCERAEVVEAGFACDEPQQTCKEGFFCNGDNCIVAGELGDSCSNDNQCADGLLCEDEHCETQLPVGTDCTTDRQCDSEICYEIDDDQRVCVDRIRLSPAEPACDSLK
jgi:hypothetical protein